MKRALSLSTNPTGLAGAAVALYAAAVMLYNVANHHGIINVPVVIAAASAAAFLYSRFKVTPTADPKDGNGNPLTTAPAGGGVGGASGPLQVTPGALAAAAETTTPPTAAGA